MKWACFFTVAEVWVASSGKNLMGAAGVSQGEELVDVTLQAGVLCLYIRKISEISASHLSHAADGPLSLTVGAPGGEWWQEPYRSEVTFEF